MARVLAISSQVAYGPVGLTALVPPLQARGHEVLAVPTVTLSNHPGHGPPAGFRTKPEDLRAILSTLDRLGALEEVDAVLTGYFASAAQVEDVALAIRDLTFNRPPPAILVDPVIGDDDALYVPEDVARAIRNELVPLATILTPNRFELEWLSGEPAMFEDLAVEAAKSLRACSVLVTSVPHGEDEIVTLLVVPDGVHRHVARKLAHVPHGTGDFLSGAYLAERLMRPPAEAFSRAMTILDHAIVNSAGSPVLAVASALHGEGTASKHPAP